MDQNRIRNFCIIAHIDHGKSTLADRFLEITETVSAREMKDQLLDQMDLERERGITIKLQPVSMLWNEQLLNMIDTPGHVDFAYEVSRSLAAVEGAILLVDATQGVQAQTLANLYLAIEQNLTVIPVINKIDLPAADPDRVTKEIIKILGCSEDEILRVSAKTGEGVAALLDAVVARIEPPKSDSANTKALIFDSHYSEFKGVITYIRLRSGSFKPGDVIRLNATNATSPIIEVGIFTPQMHKTTQLEAGQIGYIISSIKDIELTKVGDTVCKNSEKDVEPLTGYREVKPMVYAGIYPEEGSEFERLRTAIGKLKLNDASLVYEPENSPVLGFGFRCGFLGLLHLEIFQERLKREFDIITIVTAPSVAYSVKMTDGSTHIITAPTELPEVNYIDYIEEPYANLTLITPKDRMGLIMDYISELPSQLKNTEFIDDSRVIISYELPLSQILTDFYDKIKNISSGYASYNYEILDYRLADVVKLDILVAEEVVPSLTTLVYKDKAHAIGKLIVDQLKDLIPKKQFVIKLQAAVGGTIVAGERISALRKDVTAKLYGGDVTRKRKLLEKQKKGKKKMMASGKVEIPQKAFLAVLKR